MTFEEICILASGIMCLLSIIVSLIAMMSNPYHKSTFKEMCGKITSLAFSICILVCLFGLMSYSKLGVYCYLAILLVVIIMTVFLYKTARSNFATDMVLTLTIILGLLFTFSTLFLNKDEKNSLVLEENMSLQDNVQLEVEEAEKIDNPLEELTEIEQPTTAEVEMGTFEQ